MTDDLEQQTPDTIEHNIPHAPDRDSGRTARDSERGSHKLSGGKRDRSREMLREELERNLDGAKQAEPDWKPAGRAVDEMRSGDAKPETGGGPAQDGAPAAANAPPAAWEKSAKAAWQSLPPAVKAAVAKREIDTARGVEELKSRYADIDAAIAPHREVIRAHSHTEGAAIRQLFGWFDALAKNPRAAFPALMQSFNVRPEQIFGAQQQQQVDPVTARLQQIEQHFSQQIGGLQQNFQAQQMERTNQILNQWSKDKPHFEAVRAKMAHLIGTGVIPLTPAGAVNLNSAYDASCKLIPEVWNAIQQEQRAAERAASSGQANRARRAGVSLSGGAPGAAPAGNKTKQRGKTVRESLREALEESQI